MVKYLATRNIYLLIGGGCHSGAAMELLRSDIDSWIRLRDVKAPKLLMVQFARTEDRWDETFLKYKKSYLSNLLKQYDTRDSVFASKNKNEFKIQLKQADIIVLVGGSEINLKKYLRKSDFPLKGKLVIATSAGTNFLSKYYYSNMRQTTEKGVGILPFKTVCHYTNDKLPALDRLAHTASSFPTLFIREDRFRTIIF